MPRSSRLLKTFIAIAVFALLVPTSTFAPLHADEGELWGAFFDVVPLEAIRSNTCDRPGSLSASGLELYFESARQAGSCDGNSIDLYRASRASDAEPFDAVERLELSLAGAHDSSPKITLDARRLYFVSNRAGSVGGTDIWLASRTSDVPDAAFTDVRPLAGPVNSTFDERQVSVSCDELVLVFHSLLRPGGRGMDDLWIAERSDPGEPFGEAVNMGSVVNTSVDEWAPHSPCSGRTVFFADWWRNPRPGGTGDVGRIWGATRSSTEDAFGTPIPFSIDAPGIESFPAVSFDWPVTGSKIYFASSALIESPWQMYEATWIRVPVGLEAEVSDEEVRLSWRNCDAYDELHVLRGEETLATLDVEATLFTDSDPLDGCVEYSLKIAIGSLRGESSLDNIRFPPLELPTFLRGRVNADLRLDVSDAVYVVDFLFLGGPAPGCLDSADVDDNSAVELTDAIYLLGHLFLGGPAPSAPFDACGPDSVRLDPLDCVESAACP